MVVLILLFLLAALLVNIDLPNDIEEVKIDMIIKSKYGSQWELISLGAYAAANEYGAQLAILAPDYEKDVLAQKSLLLNARNESGDVIILAPINYSQLKEPVVEISNHGIPVMTIVSEWETTDVYSSLTSDYIEVGNMLGEALVREIGLEGNIVIVATVNDALIIEQKLQGLNEFLDMKTNIKLLEIIYTATDIYSVERRFYNYLQETNIDGIITLDTVSTIGIGKAIERLDINIGAIGTNIYEDDLYLLDEGYFDQIVDENFFAIGYLAVENSINKIKDNDVFVHKKISAYVINKNNMYDNDIQKIIFPIK